MNRRTLLIGTSALGLAAFAGGAFVLNQRRAAELCRLNRGFGISTVVALVSPIEFERQQARQNGVQRLAFEMVEEHGRHAAIEQQHAWRSSPAAHQGLATG